MDLGKAASSCLPHRHALRGAVALNKIAHHAPFTPEDIQVRDSTTTIQHLEPFGDRGPL